MSPASLTDSTPSTSSSGSPSSVTACTFSAGTCTVATEPTGTSTRSSSVRPRLRQSLVTGPYGVCVVAFAQSSSPVTAGAIVIER